tara:strand:+ start:133 stop:600 length:468 start_codon:yes stop_codon:yes gene_type:complete
MTIQHELGSMKRLMRKAIEEAEIDPLIKYREDICRQYASKEERLESLKVLMLRDEEMIKEIDEDIEEGQIHLKNNLRMASQIQTLVKNYPYLEVEICHDHRDDLREPEMYVRNSMYYLEGAEGEDDPYGEKHTEARDLHRAREHCQEAVQAWEGK